MPCPFRLCGRRRRPPDGQINMLYIYHALKTRPRSWAQVSSVLQANTAQHLEAHGGRLYGVFRNQIGRPRDELSVITAWPEGLRADGERAFFACAGDHILAIDSRPMHPTLRPTEFAPPTRQGNFAFRWFATPQQNYDEFLALCEAAWPGFESSYDSQVLGLWRLEDGEGHSNDPGNDPGKDHGADHEASAINTLLLTRRPDLAMWERSKIPSGAAEEEVRRKLSRRYELCDATSVFTTTLLTAKDQIDAVRWS